MKTMSAIYQKVRHRLTDDWAYGNDMDARPWDFQVSELRGVMQAESGCDGPIKMLILWLRSSMNFEKIGTCMKSGTISLTIPKLSMGMVWCAVTFLVRPLASMVGSVVL